MRILLIYPGHSHSTIDVAVGYEGALRSLGHDVRAFNYHNQLAFYSEALRHWLRVNPEFRVNDPGEAALLLASEQVIFEAIDLVPDVVLIVSGFALHRRAYDLLDSLGLPLALILTESPYLDEEQAKIIIQGHIRLAFTNERTSVDRLEELGGARVEYLPHSFDSTRHFSRDAEDGYQSDVFFFGTMWPERGRLLWPLKGWIARWRRGWRIQIEGVKSLGKGLIDNDELIKSYNGTRIALNHHRTIAGADENGRERHINEAWSLGPRAYEIAACATFQLCDDTRGELAEVFGDTVAMYRDGPDLRRKVDYYLTHDDEREEMAWAAHGRVQTCSFEERAEAILLPAIEEVL